MSEIKITLDDDGNLSVKGPIDNLILCYGMLERAKETIGQHWRSKQKEQGIKTVSPILPQ